MKHLEKYGRYVTPELIQQMGLPLGKESLPSPDSTLTTEQMDEHLVLFNLILDHVFSQLPHKENFIELHNAWAEAERELLDIKKDDNNSFCVCRSSQIVREHVGIAELVVTKFIERLSELNHWTFGYINTGKLSQYHPFVQFLYLTEAHAKMITDLEESLPDVPASEIDVPTN